VTLDVARICAFLGLDHDAWSEGFRSLPEMFAWVVESPWFSVAPYLDEIKGNLQKQAAERTTVSRFVGWLRAEGVDKRPIFADRASYLSMVAAAFPEADLPAQVAREREAEARHRAFTEKFNGKRVMRLVPGLAGKAPGELIVRLKASMPDFEAWYWRRRRRRSTRPSGRSPPGEKRPSSRPHRGAAFRPGASASDGR
jgi:hypothetical protein